MCRLAQGTWQFLSAHALRNSEKEIVVQDELESFFHVLVYMAIRFLPHNCTLDNVGRLLFDYFDASEETSKGYSCGKQKWHSMTNGQIIFTQDHESVPLCFKWSETSDSDHCVEEIVKELLKWFKAYYAVTKRDAPKPKLALTKEGAYHPKQDIAPSVDSGLMRSLFEDDGEADNDAESRPPTPTSASKSKPSPDSAAQSILPSDSKESDREQRNLAAKLNNHRAMLELLRHYLDNMAWPEKDKSEDKRPKAGYKPKDDKDHTRGAARSQTSQGLKHKLDEHEELSEEPRSIQRRRVGA
ncbi:hypothetical protein C8Q77DRAFT_332756 [Trametes polyzona]|nr:hypothetical protein C8Q77DRAFT_332756 [Trametes polyzona]